MAARLTMRVRPIMALLRDAISVSQVSRIDMLRWHASPCATGSDVVNIKGTLHKASTEPQLRYSRYHTHVAIVTDMAVGSASYRGAGRKHAAYHGGSRPREAAYVSRQRNDDGNWTNP
jgi:hypothetical protein